MQQLFRIILKILHRLYEKCFIDKHYQAKGLITDPDEVSSLIRNLLENDNPCMIARYGSVELNCVTNYISIKKGGYPIFKYITNGCREWWWNEKGKQQMIGNAGFFPNDEEHLASFSEIIMEDSKQIDILGSWRREETIMQEEGYLNPETKFVQLLMLEPYWASNPWSKALEGKKVLVIHPFALLIEEQYKNHREALFSNPDVLPAFELTTITAVQSLGGKCNQFNNWFEALDWMKAEMDKTDYDIALVGCGAYGMPLAAHAKRTGHKAVHIGGALQLLFGIKGKRWEDPKYGVKEWGIPEGKYYSSMNEFWIKPGEKDKPKNFDKVENGCYW